MLLAAPFPEQPPLVANGSFEQLAGERPAQWDVYVAPVSDDASPARAMLAKEARDGAYSVLLENPQPYPIEPYNNWSQNILAKQGGKRLKLSVWAKTENAGGASAWLQCWKRDPLRVVEVANTSDLMPLFGTNDWTELSTELTVPNGTDFMTLRCVLKGSGKAWFDQATLSPVETPPPPEIEKAEPSSPPPPTPQASDSPAMPETATAATETAASDAAATVPDKTNPEPQAVNTEAIEAELARLREANALLSEALKSMRADNEGLLGSIQDLQSQIQSLEQLLNPPPPPPDAVPPLVPRDGR